jgi:hypothetical protein
MAQRVFGNDPTPPARPVQAGRITGDFEFERDFSLISYPKEKGPRRF